MLTESLHSFFSEIKRESNEHYMVVREDGTPIFSHEHPEQQSMAALVGGVWQAAFTLSDYFSGNKEPEDAFRLSFDTSEKGIYIIPFRSKETKLLLVLIYDEEINPGKLKNKIRVIRAKLENFLQSSTGKSEKKASFLFNNLSDEEIDNAFNF